MGASATRNNNATGMPSKHQDGFFIANEGWLGHEDGDLFFYSCGSYSLQAKVYQKENPNDSLETPATTREFTTVFNHKIYLVALFSCHNQDTFLSMRKGLAGNYSWSALLHSSRCFVYN